MGHIHSTGRWIPGGSPDERKRAARAADRQAIARQSFAAATRGDRPVEEAVGSSSDGDPVRRAARQAQVLSGDELGKRVRMDLAIARAQARHGTEDRREDPADASERTVDLLDRHAREVDDQVEADEDDTEIYDEWLHQTYGLTAEQLEAALEELGEDAETVLEALEDEYERALGGVDDDEDEGYEDDVDYADEDEEDHEGEFDDSFQPDARRARIDRRGYEAAS